MMSHIFVQGESTDKARGFLRLMNRPDVVGYIHLLRDILAPLRQLSKTLQSNETTLADVKESMEMAKDMLSALKEK